MVPAGDDPGLDLDEAVASEERRKRLPGIDAAAMQVGRTIGQQADALRPGGGAQLQLDAGNPLYVRYQDTSDPMSVRYKQQRLTKNGYAVIGLPVQASTHYKVEVDFVDTLRRRFASDPLNLTLAAPAVNRCGAGGKCGFDSAEWQPPMNQCWLAARVVAVKRKYGLSVDRREAAALERVLAGCDSTAMIVTHAAGTTAAPRDAPAASSDALHLYDDNRNGRITCAEARRHGIAPVPRSHPAYIHMYDRDGDGVVCE